jgi:CheY-like chemotaxis protein
MKIIVIEDSAVHQKSAQLTLTGHELTICKTHDEALKLLSSYSWPNWDVVLCDLMMPAGSNAQGQKGNRFVGEEMAVGWSLALSAAKNGAKFVAVVTDMNHHNHPASAMLDELNHHTFKIDNAKMLMTNRVRFVDVEGYEAPCDICEGTGKISWSGKDCHNEKCHNGMTIGKGKDWGDILNKLVENKF